MATITIPRGTVGSTTSAPSALYGRSSQTLVTLVDLVNAAAVKGSALATGDVIESVAVPPNTRINWCYTRVLEAADVATLNVDIGLGTDADLYVDGASIASTGLLQPTNHAVGAFWTTTFATTSSTFAFTGTYDTIDVTLMTFTGTVPTTGQLAVYASVDFLTDPQGANIADVQ